MTLTQGFVSLGVLVGFAYIMIVSLKKKAPHIFDPIINYFKEPKVDNQLQTNGGTSDWREKEAIM